MMYFKFKQPEKVTALEHEDLPQEEQHLLLQACPTLNLSMPQTKHTLLKHVQGFFRYTFDIPTLLINESTHLYDELERIYYAKLDGIDVSDVNYGRLFCNEKGDDGLSDRGLVIYLTMSQDLPDTMGIDGANSIIKDYDLMIDTISMEWQTVGEFIDSCLLINQRYITQKDHNAS